MGYRSGYLSGYADDTPGVFPDVTVYVAFGSEPGDETQTWTELEGWRSISTRRGRQRELERFQAGTATVVLSDQDRDLDPQNTAGAYSPDVLPMKQLKIEATYAGAVYPVFTGFVDSYRHAYAGPREGDVTCTIQATDGFKVLAAAELASSAYAQEVAADSPVAWWRLGESDGSPTLFDAVGARDLTVVGAPTLGADGLISRDGDTAMTIADVNTDGAEFLGGVISAKPLSVEVLIRVTPGGDGLIIFQVDAAQTTGFSLLVSGGTLNWTVATTTQAFQTVTSGAIDDNAIHHVVGTWTSGGLATLYVDGVSVGTPVTRTGTFNTPHAFAIGAVPELIGGGSQDAFEGTLDEVAVYATALSGARVAAHSEARATPWDGDTVAERIGRVLDAIDWPAAQRDLDTGTSTLSSAELDMSALDHAQKAADSDFGLLFMAADGRVTFIGRASLYDRPQEATFGDGGGAELPYRSLIPEYGDDLIRNDVTVSRVEGVAQRVRDPISVGAFLRHSYTVDGLIHDDDALSRSAAEFILSEYKVPLRRISSMVVTPAGAPTTLFPQVLGRELEDQITVMDRPPGGGAANEQDSALEGIAHTVTPMWWEATWSLAPSFGTAGDMPIGLWDETDWDESRWVI